ncbi:SIMPL domain-containing protein [Tabrizicola aquatica]|uniref:SIMPL domain-containing protein n=1 Tax=Tabrizicola aquatica TaxID=909926 RepID=UPI000CD114D5|nr:SIMPL domain-containing protein [Tabrizicola aquatica]
MRVLSALALASALALPLSSPALAQDAPAPLLNVTGIGTVEAAPDMASLSIGVTTQGETAVAALAANSAAMEAVMARLATAGVEARDMQTSNLSVNPNWTGYDSGSPTISGYLAANMLTVTIRDLAGLGQVLDAAVQDGANTLNGLSFGFVNPGPLLDEARKEAVADARARAELLAAAAGVKLGRIVSISEGTASESPIPLYKAELAAAPVPVAGGEMNVEAAVTIFYEIVQ